MSFGLGDRFAQIDATLLPAGEAAVATLPSIFELEKAIYELQYALEKRVDYGNRFTIDDPTRSDRRLASSTYI